jgi:thioredoxin reductase
MTNNNSFDVIIVGGSYSGLAAAMALGRALRKVLIIDDGKPCNRQTPHSHNFLTNDGKTPAELAAIAKLQVSKYHTINFVDGTAVNAKRSADGFKVELATGEEFATDKLIFATGIKDSLPDINELAECWGISVIHCPYCHGYEVRGEKTAILANGDVGFDFVRLISGWTSELMLFTNGKAILSADQKDKIQQHAIEIVEKEIEKVEHESGYIRNVVFRDGSKTAIDAMYAPSPFEQHCKIPESLGCELTDEGYLKVDSFQETTISGVYAIGDNSSRMRTVANAVAMGTTAGMAISKKMILEEF